MTYEKSLFPFTGCICGQPGRGKSHLALTISDSYPVHLIDTEYRASYLLQKELFKDKNITLHRAANWPELKEALGVIWASEQSSVVVIDSGSDYSTYAQIEYKRQAQAERIWPQTNWAEVYDMMDRPIDSLKAAGHDILLTARMKPKYVNDQWDGISEVPRLPQNIPYKADFIIEIEESGRVIVTKNSWADMTTWSSFEIGRDLSLSAIINMLQLGRTLQLQHTENQKEVTE